MDDEPTNLRQRHRRPSGSPPYWPTGIQIMWWSGAGPLAAGPAITKDGNISGGPHFAEPVTVVRDDADALVAWLAAGTPVLRAMRADGRGKRDDQSTLFTAETVQDVGGWAGYDVLRIAPTGRVAAWRGPFCDGWEHFRPDPDWPIPGLPGPRTRGPTKPRSADR